MLRQRWAGNNWILQAGTDGIPPPFFTRLLCLCGRAGQLYPIHGESVCQPVHTGNLLMSRTAGCVARNTHPEQGQSSAQSLRSFGDVAVRASLHPVISPTRTSGNNHAMTLRREALRFPGASVTSLTNCETPLKQGIAMEFTAPLLHNAITGSWRVIYADVWM